MKMRAGTSSVLCGAKSSRRDFSRRFHIAFPKRICYTMRRQAPKGGGQTRNLEDEEESEKSKMVSDKALTYFNDKVRAIAARLGLPATSEAVEVLRDEGTLKTAYIQFDPSVYNAETAEEVATEFVEDANVSGEGL